MKKIFLLTLVWILSITLYSQNFSIQGKFFPDLYSTIEICYITDNSITFDYIDKLEDKTLTFKEVHKDGMLFFEMPEKFPKEFNEYYYYYNKEISTNNNMLILAGKQLTDKTNEYARLRTSADPILLFASTESFEKPDPLIAPSHHFVEVSFRKYYDCSSYLTETIRGTTKEYKVENLCDYVVETPWVENVKGDGIGEGFTIKNGVPHEIAYPYLLIMNGYISYQKPHLYKMNNRIKKIKVTGVKSGKSKVLDVLDTPHPQTVDISFITDIEDIRVEIAEVYQGTKYDDTCINYLIPYYCEVLPYESTIPD